MRLIIAVLLVFTASCSIAEGTTNSVKHLSLVSHGWGQNDYGERSVVGIVSNITGSVLGHVSIQAKFYNKNGHRVKTQSAFVSNLGPHEQWRFVITPPESALTYQLEDPQWERPNPPVTTNKGRTPPVTTNALAATNTNVKQTERRFPITFGSFQVLTSFWDRASVEWPCISGLVFNKSDYQYRYVSITIKLYSGNMLVGDAEAATAELAPGDAWLFKAPVLHDDVDRYVIVRVEGVRGGSVNSPSKYPPDDPPAPSRSPTWGVSKRQPDKNW